MSSALIDELLALPPGATLKTLVRRHADRRREVAVDDPGVLTDIDTPEDYELASRRFMSDGSETR